MLLLSDKYYWGCKMLRYDIINYLIRKYGYTKYLEIGVEDGESLSQVNCPSITSVDPNANINVTHRMTSDQFFSTMSSSATASSFDIIFIDGLHVADQVERDITNSLRHLSPNGTIVVHDVNPPSEWHQRDYAEALKNGCRQWNGTVWKAFLTFRARKDLLTYTINTDWGCGIIQRYQPTGDVTSAKGVAKGVTSAKAYKMAPKFYAPIIIGAGEMTYANLDQNRQRWFNLISVEEFAQ
jgi:hypothetical protein